MFESSGLDSGGTENEQGATLLEYVLLAALLVVVVAIAVLAIGVEGSIMFSKAGSGFQGNG
ncbi:MAG: Flp family type IVb pilin [Deltaproteobacteria bacterium]|nr:Flp family type IVb pilin [Deltaproteobacteria bacterium]